MFHFTKKRAVVMAVIASLAMGAGAYAYFTSTGTGTGEATVGTSLSWGFSNQVMTGDPLTPGGPAQSLAYTVTNNSAGNQTLTKVTVSVATDSGGAWDGPGDCSAADFSVNGADAGQPYEDVSHARNIGPGVSVDDTVTIAMINTTRNQNDCKTATPPLYLAAT